MKSKIYKFLTTLLLVVFTVSLAACTAPAATEAPVVDAPTSAPTEKPAEATAVPAEPTMAPVEVKDFVTWYQYDEKNEDPASDERVGNAYLKKSIPEFNAAFADKWNWVNVPKAWDKMTAELVAAVIAGAEVPDLIELGGQQTITYINNGALMDLTEWAKQQSWFADLDPGAVLTCTGPDGGLYCIPTAERPALTYVWADRYPNGYPTTPEQFLVEAERLKAEGLYAWTYFGSTAYDGSGAGRMVFSLIKSFGGGYDDGQGNMLLNTPENVAALTFLRDTVAKGYNPETVFAGGFVEEDSFKDSSAGAIPTGLFGYRYINPLTAPDGTKYEKGSEQDMLDAIAAGDVIMRPMFAPEGKTPGCNQDIQGFGIPTGATNVEAAYDYINWIMGDLARHIEYVIGPGAGFPTLKSAQSDPQMQTPFYQQAAIAINASVCTNWAGSLTRPAEAAPLIMNTVYKLVKESPTLDIATELQAAQDEYNANN
ncbi:MAG: ABC transporter substrate-binding protein [Anaerolineaceae bacterium]